VVSSWSIWNVYFQITHAAIAISRYHHPFSLPATGHFGPIGLDMENFAEGFAVRRPGVAFFTVAFPTVAFLVFVLGI